MSEEITWYDDTFKVFETRFGLFTSYDRELVELVTGGTYGACLRATMSHLQWKREGYVPPEGKESAEWKLVDGIDLIVHIFHPEKRKFYELEKMWSELIPKEKLII